MSSSQPVPPPSPHSPSLEEASRICLLQCDRKASVPGVEKGNLPPVARSRNLRVVFRNCVSGSAKPLDGFNTPTTEGFDGERDQAPPWHRPCRIAAVLPVRRTRRSCPIHTRRRVKPRTAFRMSDHHIAVDEGIGRRALEAAIEASLLNVPIPASVGSGAGPSWLAHFGGSNVARCAPNPCKDVAQRVVPADDQSPHSARQRVEPVGVQLL